MYLQLPMHRKYSQNLEHVSFNRFMQEEGIMLIVIQTVDFDNLFVFFRYHLEFVSVVYLGNIIPTLYVFNL